MAEAIGCPARAVPSIIIAIGYSDEKVPTPPKETFESRVYFQKYNNRIKNLNMVLWDVSLEMEDRANRAGEGLQKGLGRLKEQFSKHKEKMKEFFVKKGDFKEGKE
ncbi:MAG: hypothetical protein NT001_04550 [Candidatus Woesearchaeota archaeon]|nr:hypothetical protein [Candidatus Woesearchaeota archaeon]